MEEPDALAAHVRICAGGASLFWLAALPRCAPSEAGALQEVKVLYLEGVASHQGIESWTEVGND